MAEARATRRSLVLGVATLVIGSMLLALGSFTPANAQQEGVTMHADPAFGGTAWTVGVGDYGYPAVRDSPIGNDRISSITIPAGYEVFACQHELFRGTCRTFTESTGSLDDLDNVISSFRVELKDPATQGQWSEVINTPLVPVAAATLPNGKVLMWSAYGRYEFGGSRGYTETALFDPATGSSSLRRISNTGHDMFCPGIANLADGRVLVNGGSNAAETSIYNPTTDSWEDADDMNIARGYNATTLLSDGSAFTLGGSWSGRLGNKTGERWTGQTGWQQLNGIPAGPFEGDDTGGVYRSDNHMWLFGWKNRTVFHAGPARNMHWIDTNGSGSYTAVGTRAEDQYAMNGNAVMYAPGKILANGGAPGYADNLPATANATVIDITGPDVTARAVSSMAYRRVFQASTVLPSGEVLVTGGQQRERLFYDTDSVLVAELWNPDTETFRQVAPMDVPRNYHSVGLLLSDGRVLVGGGGLCGNCGDRNHPDVQIYSPPYLFNADGTEASRPAIFSAPDTIDPGDRFSVTTDRPVSEFALVRTSAATHAVNLDQRRIPLTPVGIGNNSYQLQSPTSSGVLIPGPYLLFALDDRGVPSVATTITVTDRVDSDGDGVIDIDDAFPYDPLRSALPVVSQSSTAFGGSASRAIDGNTNGNYSNGSVSHTATESQPWWEVDLGHNLAVDLVLHNRTDCCSDRLQNFHVMVSDEPFGDRSLQNLLDDDTVDRTYITGVAPTRLEIPGAGSGRYVRVQLADTGILSLAEVEVEAGPPVAESALLGGQVIDGDGPVADVKVTLFSAGRTSFLGGTATSADGTFEFEVDTDTCYVLTFVAPEGRQLTGPGANSGGRFLNRPVCVGSEPSTGNDARLDGGGVEISGGGVVLDGGGPAGDVKVDLFTATASQARDQFLGTTRTGASGDYQFLLPAAGCYIHTFIAPEGRTFSGTGTSFLNRYYCADAGETVTGIDAALVGDALGTSIGDQVVNTDGSPAAGVRVNLFLASPDGARSTFLGLAVTNEDGNYGYGVGPGCYVVVFIAPEGRVFVDGGGQFLERSVCVEAGESNDSIDAVLA